MKETNSLLIRDRIGEAICQFNPIQKRVRETDFPYLLFLVPLGRAVKIQ